MFAPAVQIAISKANNESAKQALTGLHALAEQYDQAEEDYPRLVAAHKAKRGAKPPRLGTGTKATLARLSEDRRALIEQLAVQYASLPSSRSIISSLAQALEADIGRSKGLVKYAEAEDRPLVLARVERKAQLLAALQACEAAIAGDSAA